jgi:hypothetical protein
MGRLRSLIALPAVLALLGLGTGCAGGGFWKSKSTKLPEEVTGTAGRPDTSAVVPAGGISPLASLPSSLSWLAGKTDKTPKSGPVTLVAAWQNHIDYLPDPTREGRMGPGLAGQLFVFDQYDQPAILNGSITVDLYDETKRPPGGAPIKPERWKFNKDVIKSLRTVDERFGPNYVLFLPWPTYRPDVTRVRITVMYEPENGSFPIRALESRLSLDPTLSRMAATSASVVVPPRELPPSIGATSTGGASNGGSHTGGPNSSPGMGVIRMGGPRSSSTETTGPAQPAGIVTPLKP